MARAAKMNALGKGFSAIADAFSLARGGNVNTPVNDGKVSGYINNYFKSLDDYRNKVEQYDLMKYNNDLRLNELMFQDARNQEAIDRNQSNLNRQFNTQQTNRKEDIEREATLYEQRKDDSLNQQKDLLKTRHGYDVDLINKRVDAAIKEADYRYNLALKEAKSNGGTGTGKEFNIYTNSGQAIPLNDQNEGWKLLSIILKAKGQDIDPKDMDLLNPAFGEAVSTNTMIKLIQKYWEDVPQAKQYVLSKYGMSEYQPVSQQQQGQQSTSSNTDIPALIKSGKTNEAYQILKNDGYSDEDIQKAFEKLAPELFKVEPKRVELNSETNIETPKPEELNKIVSKYSQSVQSMFDEKPSIIGGANRVGNTGKALKIAEQIAKEKGLQGKQALDYAYQIKDEILKDINAYDNINNTIKQQEVKEGKKRMREAMLEMNKL